MLASGVFPGLSLRWWFSLLTMSWTGWIHITWRTTSFCTSMSEPGSDEGGLLAGTCFIWSQSFKACGRTFPAAAPKVWNSLHKKGKLDNLYRCSTERWRYFCSLKPSSGMTYLIVPYHLLLCPMDDFMMFKKALSFMFIIIVVRRLGGYMGWKAEEKFK